MYFALIFQEQGFSIFHNVQTAHTAPGAQPASSPIGIDSICSEIERAGRDADQSRPSGAEVRNEW
jgi:hypothetical protein